MDLPEIIWQLENLLKMEFILKKISRLVTLDYLNTKIVKAT